jgi:thioredoxin reductase
MSSSKIYDAIIVGGSYAGWSAALALGRSLRNVLVIDSGRPCNAQTPHSHNFLTQDGTPPGEIAAIAKEQVLRYPTVRDLNDLVVSATKQEDTFVVKTQSGENFTSRKLLLATGVKDTLPDIEGLKECWGISVLHCPYCHGYEVKNTKLGIIANGDVATEFTKMINHWSKNLTLFTNGPSTLSAEQAKEVDQFSIETITSPLKKIHHANGQLTKVELKDGREITLNALFTRVPFIHHTDIANQLGCDFTDTNFIKVDDVGKTNVPGLYAAGDCTTMFRSVSITVAGGTKAGIGINKELIGI